MSSLTFAANAISIFHSAAFALLLIKLGEPSNAGKVWFGLQLGQS